MNEKIYAFQLCPTLLLQAIHNYSPEFLFIGNCLREVDTCFIILWLNDRKH